MAGMDNSKSYVRTDESGVYRVGRTRVSLDSVVIGFQLGHSPETIQDQYPTLSLEEVYGAIAFYLANQQTVDDYLKKQEKVWEDFRAKVDQIPSPVVERLRKLKTMRVREQE
jgi:uncharacterized protein (DUF433 family)